MLEKIKRYYFYNGREDEAITVKKGDTKSSLPIQGNYQGLVAGRPKFSSLDTIAPLVYSFYLPVLKKFYYVIGDKYFTSLDTPVLDNLSTCTPFRDFLAGDHRFSDINIDFSSQIMLDDTYTSLLCVNGIFFSATPKSLEFTSIGPREKVLDFGGKDVSKFVSLFPGDKGAYIASTGDGEYYDAVWKNNTLTISGKTAKSYQPNMRVYSGKFGTQKNDHIFTCDLSYYLDFTSFADIAFSQKYVLESQMSSLQEYQVVEFGNTVSPALLVIQTTRTTDGQPKVKKSQYNEKLQLSRVTQSHRCLDEGVQDYFSIENNVDLGYLWESTPAALASNNLSLIETSSPWHQKGKTREDLFAREYHYKTRTSADKDTKFFLDEIREVEPLKSTSISLSKSLFRGKIGVSLLSQGIKTGSRDALKNFLVKRADFPGINVARFQNVLQQEGRSVCDAGYLGFETYEDFDSSGLSSSFWQLDNWKLVEDSYLGRRSVQASGDKAAVKLQPGALAALFAAQTYLFSCFVKKNGEADWQYFEKQCTAADVSSGVVGEFAQGDSIDHLAFRGVDALFHVWIYDDLCNNIGELNHRGYSVFYKLDPFNRSWLTGSRGVISGKDNYYPLEDISLKNSQLRGSARFKGYDTSPQSGETLDMFASPNSQINLNFREKAFVLNSGSVDIDAESVCLLMENKKTEASYEFLTQSSDKIVLKIEGTTAKLLLNGVAVEDSVTLEQVSNRIHYLLIKNVVFVVINAKLVLRHVFDGDLRVSRISSTQSQVYYTQNAGISFQYFDCLGWGIQTQKMAAHPDTGKTLIVVQDRVFDGRGQLSATTKPASIPLNAADDLKDDKYQFYFRPGFSAYTGPGPLTGEVADYYRTGDGKSLLVSPQDSDYPYTYRAYEDKQSSRPVQSRQAGAFFLKEYNTQDYQLQDQGTDLFADYQDFEGVCFTRKRNKDNNTAYKVTNASNSFLGQIYTDPAGKENPVRSFSSSTIKSNELTGHISYQPRYYEKRKGGSFSMDNELYRQNYLTVQDSDTGEQISVVDRAGQLRLTWTKSQGYRYHRYDVLGRITEEGTVKFKKIPPPSKDKLLDYLEDQNFPSSDQGDCSPKIQYTYDISGVPEYNQPSLRGLLAGVKSFLGVQETIDYQYDSFGRVISIKDTTDQAPEKVTRMSFNDAGDCLTLKYPLKTPFTLQYNYDVLGRFQGAERIDQGGNRIFTQDHKYDIKTRLLSFTTNGSLVQEHRYDFYNKLNRLSVTSKKTPVFTQELFYGWEPGGSWQYHDSRIAGKKDTTLSRPGVSNSYTYDFMGRLSREVQDGKACTYGYDQNSSLVSACDAAVSYSDKNNQISTLTQGKDAWAFSYSDEGRVGQIKKDEKNLINFTQDPYSLKTVSLSVKNEHGESTLSRKFGFMGRKRSQTLNGPSSWGEGETTTYTYGPSSHPLVVQTGEKEEVLIYSPGGSLTAVMDTKDNSALFPVKDIQTSTRVLLGDDNTPLMSYTYSSWGGTLSQVLSQSSVDFKYLYLSQEYESRGDFYYFHARDYFPGFRMFVSPDGVKRQLVNPYAYCFNDPINFIDPMGTDPRGLVLYFDDYHHPNPKKPNMKDAMPNFDFKFKEETKAGEWNLAHFLEGEKGNSMEYFGPPEDLYAGGASNYMDKEVSFNKDFLNNEWDGSVFIMGHGGGDERNLLRLDILNKLKEFIDKNNIPKEINSIFNVSCELTRADSPQYLKGASAISEFITTKYTMAFKNFDDSRLGFEVGRKNAQGDIVKSYHLYKSAEPGTTGEDFKKIFSNNTNDKIILSYKRNWTTREWINVYKDNRLVPRDQCEFPFSYEQETQSLSTERVFPQVPGEESPRTPFSFSGFMRAFWERLCMAPPRESE